MRRRDLERAKRIAAMWHGGQWSSLYALASSGTIFQGAAMEAARCLPHARTAREVKQLQWLVAFVNNNRATEEEDGDV